MWYPKDGENERISSRVGTFGFIIHASKKEEGSLEEYEHTMLYAH